MPARWSTCRTSAWPFTSGWASSTTASSDLTGGGAEVKTYSSAAQSMILLGWVPAYGALAARVSRIKLISYVTFFFVACLLAFYAGALVDVPYIGVAFYIWVGIFNYSIIRSDGRRRRGEDVLVRGAVDDPARVGAGVWRARRARVAHQAHLVRDVLLRRVPPRLLCRRVGRRAVHRRGLLHLGGHLQLQHHPI